MYIFKRDASFKISTNLLATLENVSRNLLSNATFPGDSPQD